MKNNINNHNIYRFEYDVFEIKISATVFVTFFVLLISTASCSDFVEANPPKNTLVSETVFEDPSTVKSALAGIYYNMREQGMVSGRIGFSTLLSIYSDELDYYNSSGEYLEVYNHSIAPSNTLVSAWWREAYNLIYTANDIIKGVETAANLTTTEKEAFKGEALFSRAYLHSLLVNVYGDIPYIQTTNYIDNNTVARMPETTVYDLIISDLLEAVALMDDSDDTGEHVIPNKTVAQALLARMYLYTEQWALAESIADELISAHDLELDINKVFLNNSTETLWQFKPKGISYMNTYEANQFVIQFIPGQTYALSDHLLNAFELGDLRFSNWTGSLTSDDGLTTLYFPYKYKALLSETAALEYSIIFRLTEQYFIRAESRTHLGDISGAQEDLNAIRNRAGLENTTAASETNLLEAILQERQVELFTEHGHRWFDLKRRGSVSEALSPIKSNWQDTDTLFPIPETELEVNPNLKPQNTGY